jgi:hypothetical protein
MCTMLDCVDTAKAYELDNWTRFGVNGATTWTAALTVNNKLPACGLSASSPAAQAEKQPPKFEAAVLSRKRKLGAVSRS